MTYLDLLRQSTDRTNSIICVGLDPVLEKIPLQGDPEAVITKFYIELINAFVGEDCLPGAFKPNSAFYEQYGFEGLRALKKVIMACRAEHIPVILDAKRGDIGKTSTAYAKAVFDFWQVDSLTVAPYMGSDSVQPFMEYCDKGKGLYILARTSNKGAVDFQDLKPDGVPLHVHVAKKIIEWAKPGTGAVVGATYPEELQEIATLFVKAGKEMPLLIPGVGGQGGSIAEVMRALNHAGYDLRLCRINSSSGINYAYEKQGTDDYAGAAVKALQQLNKEAQNI